MRVDFLVYGDTDRPGEREYVPAGYELAAPISIASANFDPDAVQREFPRVSARFARSVESYWIQGELLLRHKHGELAEMRLALIKGKAHKFHPLLVADYRARKGTRSRIHDMETAFNVHRSTIYRELQAALERGLISEDELERRPPPAA